MSLGQSYRLWGFFGRGSGKALIGFYWESEHRYRAPEVNLLKVEVFPDRLVILMLVQRVWPEVGRDRALLVSIVRRLALHLPKGSRACRKGNYFDNRVLCTGLLHSLPDFTKSLTLRWRSFVILCSPNDIFYERDFVDALEPLVGFSEFV